MSWHDLIPLQERGATITGLIYNFFYLLRRKQTLNSVNSFVSRDLCLLPIGLASQWIYWCKTMWPPCAKAIFSCIFLGCQNLELLAKPQALNQALWSKSHQLSSNSLGFWYLHLKQCKTKEIQVQLETVKLKVANGFCCCSKACNWNQEVDPSFQGCGKVLQDPVVRPWLMKLSRSPFLIQSNSPNLTLNAYPWSKWFTLSPFLYLLLGKKKSLHPTRINRNMVVNGARNGSWEGKNSHSFTSPLHPHISLGPLSLYPTTFIPSSWNKL